MRDITGIEIIAIGCSAGCFEVLGNLLPGLDASMRVPIVVLLHLPPDSGAMLVDSFSKKCAIAVKEAEDKEPIKAGVVYFAPANYHLLVEPEREFSLSSEEAVNFSRPSIDVLFESVAMAYGPAALAIVLTGANGDGAQGLKLIAELGGRAIVQNPATARYCTMPEAAMGLVPTAELMTVEELGKTLAQFGKKEGRR